MRQREITPRGKKSKHGRHRRRSKPHHNNTSTREENPNGAEEEYDPDQPTFEQAEQEHGQASPNEQVTDGYLEDDNYMLLSEDEVSLGDDEFGVPEDPIEQERFKRRLIATPRSLKKKQQQLQADQDLLADKWTEVLAAEEYGLEPPSRGYPKHKPLEEEAEEPELPAQDEADRPPRGRDKTTYQPAPHLRFTMARGNMQDLRDTLENKAG